jgi:DNA-binding GntR family transcriptional regulator
LPDRDRTPEVSRSPLVDHVYNAIQDRLVMLDIPPHAAIVEGELADQLGAGRTAVREALKRLELERLVVSYPRRGTFADLGHISEVRAHLEPLAAARAAETRSDAVRTELLEMAARTDKLRALNVDRRELLRWDLTVHRGIYRAARNPHLEDVLIRHDNLATRIFCVFLDRLPTVQAHVGELSQLLGAIIAGDAETASRLAYDHVIAFEAAVRAVI